MRMTRGNEIKQAGLGQGIRNLVCQAQVKLRKICLVTHEGLSIGCKTRDTEADQEAVVGNDTLNLAPNKRDGEE